MGIWRGDVPEIMDSESLTELVRQQEKEVFDRFPLLRLFVPQTYASEKIVWEIVKHIRKLADIHMAPAPGDRTAYRQFGEMIGKVFYLAQTFNVPSEFVAALRFPGESKDANMFALDARSRALRHVREETEERVWAINRTIHYVCCQILQAITTISVDGYDVPLDFGLTVTSSGVDWGVGSNDLLADWEDIILQFKRQAGGFPTHIAHGGGFRKKYLITNDDIRNHYQYNPELSLSQMPADMLLKATGRVDPIDIWDQYDASGTLTDLWDDKYLLLAKLDRGRTLEMATARTMDNNYEGGSFSYSEMKSNPRRLEVTVGSNSIPLVRNTEPLMLVDVTSP